MSNELKKFLGILSREIRQILEQHPQGDNLIEIEYYLDSSPKIMPLFSGNPVIVNDK